MMNFSEPTHDATPFFTYAAEQVAANKQKLEKQLRRPLDDSDLAAIATLDAFEDLTNRRPDLVPFCLEQLQQTATPPLLEMAALGILGASEYPDNATPRHHHLTALLAIAEADARHKLSLETQRSVTRALAATLRDTHTNHPPAITMKAVKIIASTPSPKQKNVTQPLRPHHLFATIILPVFKHALATEHFPNCPETCRAVIDALDATYSKTCDIGEENRRALQTLATNALERIPAALLTSHPRLNPPTSDFARLAHAHITKREKMTKGRESPLSLTS